MKLRIVKHQRVCENGAVDEWFTVQMKGWLWFWKTYKVWKGSYAGGEYETVNFLDYSKAEQCLAILCDNHRKRQAAKKIVQPRSVVADVTCE